MVTTHQNWTISVIRRCNSWLFYVCDSDDPLTNDRLYPSPEEAQIQARCYIDRIILTQRMMTALSSHFEVGAFSFEVYADLIRALRGESV